MRNKLNQWLQQTEIAGLSAAVLDSSIESYYLGKMGKVEPYTKQNVRSGMLYDIASLTKVVGTTTRIFQLLQTKQLTLESRCSIHLPEFPQLTMTVEELLRHSSGLPADFVDKQAFNAKRLPNFLQSMPFKQPGKIVYSDIGYLLLGLMIERIDQMDLEASFHQAIFSPLKMQHTTYFPSKNQAVLPTEMTQQRGLIVGEVHDSKAFSFGRPVGSAGLFSSLNDLILFTQALLKNQLGNELFLAPAIYEQLKRSDQKRTLGWEMPFGEGIIYHTGFTGTSIGIDLFRKRALILLTNRVHPTRETPNFYKQRRALYEEFFKESSR